MRRHASGGADRAVTRRHHLRHARGDGTKQPHGDVFSGLSFLDPLDDLRSREHGAIAVHHRVRLGFHGQLVQLLHRHSELQRDRFEKRTRARGALGVHAVVGQLPFVRKPDDLGVLPADVDDVAHLWVPLSRAPGVTRDFRHLPIRDGNTLPTVTGRYATDDALARGRRLE